MKTLTRRIALALLALVILTSSIAIAEESTPKSIISQSRQDPSARIVLNMDGYKQTEWYTCGSASSLMVLYYSGMDEALKKDKITNDKQFHAVYRKHSDSQGKGIWIGEIKNALNHYLGSNTYTSVDNIASADDLFTLVPCNI